MAVQVERWGPGNRYIGVRVRVRLSADGPRFSIGAGGQCVLHAPEAMVRHGRDKLRGRLHRYIDDYFNPLPAGTYVRVHFDPADYEHLVAGTHRGSTNHATGETEDGLSVAVHPETPDKHGYYVTGTCIGQGADGEPVLDLESVRVTSRRMSGRSPRTWG